MTLEEFKKAHDRFERAYKIDVFVRGHLAVCDLEGAPREALEWDLRRVAAHHYEQHGRVY